jgi:hypothetical protein
MIIQNEYKAPNSSLNRQELLLNSQPKETRDVLRIKKAITNNKSDKYQFTRA